MKRLLASASAALLAMSACAGPGQYSYARVYTPTSDEDAALRGAVPFDPVEAQSQPGLWQKQRSWLVGIVKTRGQATEGYTHFELDLRRLEKRNRCDSLNDESSCRVTVSEKSFGSVSAVAKLSVDDDVGEHAVGPGSMLRLVGVYGPYLHEADTRPIFQASFYRHFPRGQFITTQAADVMRQ